jgi:hypothetical protein
MIESIIEQNPSARILKFIRRIGGAGIRAKSLKYLIVESNITLRIAAPNPRRHRRKIEMGIIDEVINLIVLFFESSICLLK